MNKTQISAELIRNHKKIVFIGHRGTGKSELLKRLQDSGQFSHYQFLDLDSEIEKTQEKSISEIFHSVGEVQFRELEKSVFANLFQANSAFIISVGAGFAVDQIPDEAYVFWIRRASDQRGRIFLDRPRLNPELSELEEFKQRYQLRQPKYAQRADEIYEIPEGRTASALDVEFFKIPENPKESAAGADSQAGFTFLRSFFEKKKWIMNFLKFQKFSFIELRTDLLTRPEMQEVIEIFGRDQRYILSFRADENGNPPDMMSMRWLQKMVKDFKIQDVDWDQDLGPAIPETTIISSHSSEPPASDASGNIHLKWAPVVKNWMQLDRLYAWWDFDRENRSLLPRSEADRQWTWIRLFLKGKQKLNFVQFFGGSALDQPTWAEWLKTDSTAQSFAAVLGFPVSHSASPEFHHSFFARKQMNFYALTIEPTDFETAFGLLNELGLCACAVTSPLKAVVADFFGHHGQVMNTLYRDQDGGWLCDNTDQPALKDLFETIKDQPCIVWGGGAMQTNLRSLLLKATEYSASLGKPREESHSSAEIGNAAKILIWGAEPLAKTPQEHGLAWPLEVVYDLNYREDSQARAFAKNIQARYVSGEDLFKKQALRQQDLWKGL